MPVELRARYRQHQHQPVITFNPKPARFRSQPASQPASQGKAQAAEADCSRSLYTYSPLSSLSSFLAPPRSSSRPTSRDREEDHRSPRNRLLPVLPSRLSACIYTCRPASPDYGSRLRRLDTQSREPPTYSPSNSPPPPKGNFRSHIGRQYLRQTGVATLRESLHNANSLAVRRRSFARVCPSSHAENTYYLPVVPSSLAVFARWLLCGGVSDYLLLPPRYYIASSSPPPSLWSVLAFSPLASRLLSSRLLFLSQSTPSPPSVSAATKPSPPSNQTLTP